MNRDRLNELRGGSPRNDNNANKYQYNQIEEASYDIKTNNGNSFMDQIRELEQMLTVGKSNVEKIKKLYAKSLVSISQNDSNRDYQILENLRSETSTLFKKIGNTVKSIDNETKRQGNNRDTPIRKAQVSRISKELKNVLSEYTDVQRKFKNDSRDKMIRQYRVVNSNATDEEIERALDNPNINIFSQGLTMSAVNSQSALREAREKHDDMKKIEQSINELCTLFQDMETLLMTQNETLINIENHVYGAEHCMEEGSKQMSQAIEIRKRSRKTLWIITGVVAVIVIILLIILAPYISAIGDIFGGSEE